MVIEGGGCCVGGSVGLRGGRGVEVGLGWVGVHGGVGLCLGGDGLWSWFRVRGSGCALGGGWCGRLKVVCVWGRV